ncbi:hypothetical protein [Streptomyces carpinensis]|uniref:Uncharacterized protein n=1 Tax=Streptomyces carpinensis TaxID=66369 RepID=A0ABV1W074_9ACTN|nr:hypothetical protein [Streptomyces carpinensis]
MSVSASVPARRLAAAALAAAALVGAVALLASAADHGIYRKRVQITEPRYDFPGREDRSLQGLALGRIPTGIGGDTDLFEDRCQYAWKHRHRHRHLAQRPRPHHRHVPRWPPSGDGRHGGG